LTSHNNKWKDSFNPVALDYPVAGALAVGLLLIGANATNQNVHLYFTLESEQF
jgi:hypothetical protein